MMENTVKIEAVIGNLIGIPVTLHGPLWPVLCIPRTCPFCGSGELRAENWVLVCEVCGTLISRINDTISI